MKRETKRKLVSILFPEKCPYCRIAVKPCEIACEECTEKLPSRIYEKTVNGSYKVLSAVPYKDNFADAIKRIKFGGKKQYAYQLAKLMYEKLNTWEHTENYDVITFVPLHEDTLKSRGFNQSKLLAEELAYMMGLPCLKLLKKTKKNQPQHNLTADKREKNVKGVFKCEDKSLVKGKKILVIDDIVTTGFTLGECTKILADAEAESIQLMTFALSLPKTT